MRRIEIVKDRLVLTDEVEVVYEKRVTPFGTSAKVSVPKRHIGHRAYVVILKD
ncbi:MAG: DUF2080 family transposase-associated protein [Candidatus Syntropharchaeia archaeon]